MLQAKPMIIAWCVWPPRLRTSCHSLPPEGAAAPMARQSRFHGPCLKGSLFQPLAAGRLIKQGPRDWLCQTAGAAAPSGGQGATRSEQPWGLNSTGVTFQIRIYRIWPHARLTHHGSDSRAVDRFDLWCQRHDRRLQRGVSYSQPVSPPVC